MSTSKYIESVLLLQAASVLILKILFYQRCAVKPKTPEESTVELATPECFRLEDCLYYILTQENFKKGDFHSKKSILTIKHLSTCFIKKTLIPERFCQPFTKITI